MPYEPPEKPELHLQTDRVEPDQAVGRVLDHLRSQAIILPRAAPESRL